MAQLQSPETYADGQQVTAARLNNQTNGAIALPGLITDQTNITANTVASNDSVLLYDLSATALREANVSDVLGSNLPVTTSAVTAGANSDVVVTPNNGTIVSGQAYTSGDGLTVTVTSTAHTLVVGQVILVTAAATGYNGTFRVATVATNLFTYVMTTAATPGSSTLSYTKLGSVRNTGNESVTGSLFVAGNAVISGTTAIAGATTISGATTVSGAFTSNGTANFTGQLQVNGSTAYALYEISTETVTPWTSTTTGAFDSIWTSAAFVKPADEIWAFELCFHYIALSGYKVELGFRYSTQSYRTGEYIIGDTLYDWGNSSWSLDYFKTYRWTVGTGTALASQSLKVDVYVDASSNITIGGTSKAAQNQLLTTGTFSPSQLRIYKYKTA